MSKKRDRAEFDAVLAQYGESFDLDESTGKATVTLSDEAEIILGKAATKKGLDLPTYLTKVCQHLIDRILDERDKHEAEAEFLPWSPEEYDRHTREMFSDPGVFCDIDSTGIASISLTPEAETRLTKDAAQKGMNLDTYLHQLWQDSVDRALAKARAAKI